MKLVPITNRQRLVVAHAKVDYEDEGVAVEFSPWHLTKGYAKHTVYLGGGRANGSTMTISLARLVLGLLDDDPRRVDHRNRDRLDNQKRNLRIATAAQNNQNMPARGGSSSYRGVCWDRQHQKWRATVRLDGRLWHLGRFALEEEAAAVAEQWRREHMAFAEPQL